jgi:Outer membrane protein beta-barrel domain
MRDPEFEKHVQQKLGELQFPPSDIVWQNVDKEINKEKKRRIPFFWLFFLGGTTLVLLSGYWLFIPRNKNISINNKIESEKINVEKRNLDDEKIAGNEVSKATEKKKIISVNEINKNNKPPINQQQSLQGQKGTLSETKSVPFSLVPIPLNAGKNSPSGTRSKKTNQPAGNLPEENNQGENKDQVKVNSTMENKEQSNSASPEKMLIAKTKPDSPGSSPAGSNKINQSKKQKSYTYGLEAGTGMSGVIRTIHSVLLVPNGTTSYHITSASHPDIAFHLGLFLQKQLSRKIEVSAGIDYHYYSVRINTGTKIDSVVYPSYLAANSSAIYTSAIPRNALYTSGTSQRYTNGYHFIALPLLVTYQLNRSPKIPIRVEAGIYLSYLAGTNALQFDPVSDTYYKDNGLFNRLQPVLSTRIAFGFHNRNTLFQLGPEIQYGTSDILKSNASIREQLLYGGIKLSLTSQKK